MIKVRKESNKVLYAKSGIISISKNDINHLIKLADKNPDRTIRLCTHKNKKDTLNEMIIIHPRNYKVKEHMHPKNAESMMIIKGSVDVLIYSKKKKLIKTIKMGEFGSKKAFYYKIPQKTLHTLIIKSRYLIFYEVSKGKFSKNKNFYPDWN